MSTDDSDQGMQDSAPEPVGGERLGGLGGDLLGAALSSSSSLGSLLQAFTGGAAPAEGEESPGGLPGVLGGLLGGDLGQGLPAAMSELAGKLNLSSETVQAIVAFVLGKLVGGQPGKAVQLEPTLDEQEQGQPLVGERLDLGSLLAQAGGEQEGGESSLSASGWAEELAEKVGLDRDKAAEALMAVIRLLGGEGLRPAKSKRKRKSTKKTTSSTSKAKSKKKATTSTSKAKSPKKKATSSTSKPKSPKKKATSSASKPKSTKKKATSSASKPKSTKKATSSTSKAESTKKATSSTSKAKSTKKKATSSTSKAKSTGTKKKATTSRSRGSSKKPSS